MSDDFLFDPWSSGEGEEASPPGAEPELGGRPEVTDRSAGLSGRSRWRERAVLGPIPVERSVPGVRPGAATRPSSIEPLGPTTDLASRARSGSGTPPRTTDSTVDRIRGIALPNLEAVAARLQIARHHTLLDDRLDSPAGVIRFRLVPRSAPFDEPAAVPGSVLELVATEATIEARLWLDPVAEEPADELEISVSQFTEEWLQDVMVEFVAGTLCGG